MAEYLSGNIFIRQHTGDMMAGDVVEGHAHNFDHTTFCLKGRIEVTRLDTGATVIVNSQAKRPWVLIEAGVEHKLVALDDHSEYLCVYSHRTHDGEVTEQYTGWGPAYG